MKEILSDTPTGWTDLIVRIVKVAVIAFVLLQAKEWLDAGAFDTPATLTDALVAAGGIGALYVIQMLVRPPKSPNKPPIRQ
jgi:hypothetical protein